MDFGFGSIPGHDHFSHIVSFLLIYDYDSKPDYISMYICSFPFDHAFISTFEYHFSPHASKA